MSTIVLVPGAGLGAWAWDRVVPLLEASGHDVHAVTPAGLADEDRGRPADGIGLSARIDALVALLERDDLREVVLVGHSLGGLAVHGAAAAVPERIARLVLLDAVLPVDGVSAFGAAGPEFEQAITALAQASGEPTRVPWFSDEQLDAHYPGHELSAEDRAAIAARSAG